MKRLVALVLFLTVLTARADLANGIRAYNEGDEATAYREFNAAAEKGDAMGLHLLASLYYTGRGVKQDRVRAAELFTQAAAKGYRASQANLGLMYQKGDGVPKDMAKAISYFDAAAQQGDMKASFQLGQIYRKGEGVPVDLAKAAHYYKSGAERGDLPSANEYGLLFADGPGHKDYVEAYAWLSYVAKSGNQDTAQDLAQLEKLLGDKIGEAETRARAVEKLIRENRPAAP